MKVQRPSAYELSFGEPLATTSTTSSSRKRPYEEQSGSSKKFRSDSSNSYRAPEGVEPLSESTDGTLAPLWGEVIADNDTKPIRLLTEFCIYDSEQPHAFVSLKNLEGNTRQAAGYVAPRTELNDEDDAQEEEEDAEDYRQYIVLGKILRWSCSYDLPQLVVYIETAYAWYILQKPSESYRDTFHATFLGPQLIAHSIIAAIRDKKAWGPTRDTILHSPGPSADAPSEQDIKDSVWAIESALYSQDDPLEYLASDLVMYCNLGIRTALESANQHALPAAMRRAATRSSNIDNDALTRQSKTMVTPKILGLCEKYFPETLTRLGRRVTVNKAEAKEQQKARKEDFRRFCRKFHESYGRRRKIIYPQERDRELIKSVTIDNEVYEVGDVIVVPYGKDESSPVPEIPEEPKEGDFVEDFFWFGQIKYIDLRASSAVAHVQWLWSSKHTILQEMGSPQELFFCDKLCGPVPLSEIMGKIILHESHDADQPKPPANEYYCRYYYLPDRMSFVSIREHQRKTATVRATAAPDYCHSCRVDEQEENWQSNIAKKHGDAISCHGHYYHVHDFVLIRRPVGKKQGMSGPADIGYIVKVILSSQEEPVFLIRKVGRFSEVPLLPNSMNRDEKHLFLTDETARVSAADFIQPIHVLPCIKRSLDEESVKQWLAASPSHFYMHYSVPSIMDPDMTRPKEINPSALPICAPCLEKSFSHAQDLLFLRTETPTLNILDLFAGCGAFSQSLAEGYGNAKLTHAVEISPSACKTIKHNSPDTKVYNNCANDAFEYAKKRYDGIPITPPVPIYNKGQTVPKPPKPGKIDIITAGFPCQSHSTLNQHKQHSDAKNSLILTTLSWVDFLRPSYAYFENVPGFMSYKLKDEDGHEVDMGGIKLTVQAMLDMGYQVRFALLQAGHYGTPQRRRRFFLIAAKAGLDLPELPQPTHDFPESAGLDIRVLPGERRAAPVRAAHGVALHKYVSLADAIGDLPLFNWKDPLRGRSTRLENNVPSFSMDNTKKRSGFDGVPDYRHPPRTSIQMLARRREPKDLQHFTKWMSIEKIQRVRGVRSKQTTDTSAPDYSTLPREQQEFQTYNPASAAAKKRHRPGAYRKLDNAGVFPTVTTNIDPTAKQNQCLHPDCLRIVSVRELARAQGFPDDFVFKSLNDVITMHRQIGNAVPWPIGRALGRELAEARLRDSKPRIDLGHE